MCAPKPGPVSEHKGAQLEGDGKESYVGSKCFPGAIDAIELSGSFVGKERLILPEN